jgi:phenylacetate-CoA ligase
MLPAASSLGLNLRRIEGFLGRSDNMVKLRGINVYPHAIAAHLAAFPECTGEYLCKATRDANGRDELTVAVEVHGARDEALAARLREHLKARLGVDVQVALEPPDALSPLTQVESRQKAIRLIDTRFQQGS